MQPNTHMGMNRTGAKMSPIDVSTMKEFADLVPETATDSSAMTLDMLRSEAVAEADAVGSVPMPGTFKGIVETGMAMLKGDRPEVLIDKLGERLAFERAGTRLYEALITKCEQLLKEPGADLLQTLRRIHDEEAEHFQILSDAVDSLGADPTAQTPCADVSAVLSMGIMQVVTDPRTNLSQSLNAIMVAELADNAGWELLIKLVRQAGYQDMALSFERAMQQEEEHLALIKLALEEAVLLEAGA